MSLADNVRRFRRATGLTQEGLAEAADLSVNTVRKIEQGGDARVETLHQLARVLGVSTADLFATAAPRSVVGVGDSVNRQALADLRRALMPPVGIVDPVEVHGEPVEADVLRQGIRDARALYDQDRYTSVARMLPELLRSSEVAVSVSEGDAKREAMHARSQVLLGTGQYLTQVRQYDMAYYALAESIRLARESERLIAAATGVVGMCWLLVRQGRFGECEDLAVRTAEEIEPRLSEASIEQLCTWGDLWLYVSAAGMRNNRPDTASDARRMAATAASAVGREHLDFPNCWGGFGPATVEVKAIEDLSLEGDVRGVLRRADEGPVSTRGLRALGGITSNNYNRHRLDVARAYASTGEYQEAMAELARIKQRASTWITHQPLAHDVMSDILKSRKRTLSTEMRDMAQHLGVAE